MLILLHPNLYEFWPNFKKYLNEPRPYSNENGVDDRMTKKDLEMKVITYINKVHLSFR